MSTSHTGIRHIVEQWATAFDARLEALLNAMTDIPPELLEAMSYSALAPGKRLRPFLVDRAYRAAGGSNDIVQLCAAVECLHAFTLIHDDLPAMDDADLRRGRATSHRVFGEALAILAGRLARRGGAG